MGPHVIALMLGAALLCPAQPAAAETAPKWEVGAGVLGLRMPDYRGSDETRSYLLPFPYVVYRLDWLKVDRKGVRSVLFDREEAEVNLSLSGNPPVRSKNNRAREGMADLKPMVEFGPSLDIHLWRGGDGNRLKLDLQLPARAAITAESRPHGAGLIFSPRLNFDIAGIAGHPWRLGMLAGPIFGTRRQHRYFYGVSDSDARPDRPAYDPPGGYGGTQFLVSLSRRFGSLWVGAYGRYDTLHGAAFADSPLVRRRTYASYGFAATWTLGRSETLVEIDD
jgi:outer membrane scaffolding protein for murein synthesis (MipA/OmpV family)